MTSPLTIAFNGFALGCHTIGLLIGAGLGLGFLTVWCSAFIVYHAITLRRVMRQGVQA